MNFKNMERSKRKVNQVWWKKLMTETIEINSLDERCPHCGGHCYPKMKIHKVIKKLRLEKVYTYQFFWFECGTCYYCSPRSRVSIEEARMLFRERVS